LGVHDQYILSMRGTQATSALDNASERVVQQALDHLAKARARGLRLLTGHVQALRSLSAMRASQEGLYIQTVKFAAHAWSAMRTRHRPSCELLDTVAK